MISAKVIAHSAYDTYDGTKEIITFSVSCPKFLLAQLNTHRVFSRNAASSRAIPVATMIKVVENSPVIPVFWGKNKPGMQADEEISPDIQAEALKTWMEARDNAIASAKRMIELGVHKQIANRLLEPWMYAQVLITSSEMDNFYALRNHPDAQPEIRAVAQAMLEAHKSSVPVKLSPEQWHIPYVSESERLAAEAEGPLARNDRLWTLLKRSAARCARVSYLKHDGTASTEEEDLKLFDRLMAGNPKHASPCEHQATPAQSKMLSGNLKGWTQFRKIVEMLGDSQAWNEAK